MSAPRGLCSGGWGEWRPPRTATAAGGTHPTGMHSCKQKCFLFKNEMSSVETTLISTDRFELEDLLYNSNT